MKVLVVGTGGALGASGITTMADQMTRTLRGMGHDPVRLVAGDRARGRPNRLNLENVAAALADAWSVARTARRAHFDLVWLHTFGVPTLPALRTLIQVLAVRAVGSRTVVHLHAFDLSGAVGRSGRLQRAALSLTAKLAERIVVLHQADAGVLARIVPERRVSVLANWVEVGEVAPPCPSGPPITALFVGSLTERKGVRHLLDAMRLLADEEIVLRLVGGAGDEGPAVAADLQASGEDLARSGRVTFVGPLDTEGVAAELAKAHVFVLASEAEGTPVSLLEAMAAARAVVVSNAGNMAEIVGSGKCGAVLPSCSPEAIAAALTDAASDVALLAEQGRRGHALALACYSESRAAEQIGLLLSTVAAASSHSARPRT